MYLADSIDRTTSALTVYLQNKYIWILTLRDINYSTVWTF